MALQIDTKRGIGAVQGGRTPGAHPLGDKMLTTEEVRVVREGNNGVKGSIPARCYYDEDVYAFEVDHILKKNWLCVGRWDHARNPGDYFTRRMFGESLIIIRGKDGQLRALINSCRHRWSQMVPEGTGHTNLLICPNHSWTYNLDGTLRGVAVADIPGMDKSKCNLHSVRLEVWQGYVFINFDPDAPSLNAQLDAEGLTELVHNWGLDKYELTGEHFYEADWNYKFSVENGYEVYHNEGVHRTILGGTIHLKASMPYKFGKNWGTYLATYKKAIPSPYGQPPWLPADAKLEPHVEYLLLVSIYPSFIAVVNPHKTLVIRIENGGVASNRASTLMAAPPWARATHAEQIAKDAERSTVIVQEQDNQGCRNLQAGVTSRFNTDSLVHTDLEPQLSHYYNWFVDQYLAAGPSRE